jgi:UbiD family decarboxylase
MSKLIRFCKHKEGELIDLRSYLQQIQDQGELVRVHAPISRDYEIAGVLKKLEPKPVLFENVVDSDFRIAGNLFCSKAAFASYLGLQTSDIIPSLARAIDEKSPCEIVTQAPCQEVVLTDPDLEQMPILRYCQGDGGRYISSGIVIARHPEYGQNMDFHRCMQISGKEMAMRVVKGRHFDTFLNDLGKVDVAVCIGNAPNVLAAAATSVEVGVDELEIANALEPLQVVRARCSDLYIPAECEFVLEGTVVADRRHAEGPFIDLTGTYDIVRNEPVFIVKAITHRRDAIWHALLPGALEHKLLMGMPREPTIYKKVNEVVRCVDVNVNPGGCSWLHAIVQIDKQSELDGMSAIQAAFEGHRSCKHVFIVDRTLIFTILSRSSGSGDRFQGDRSLVIKDKEPGSSLDPSADPQTHLTTKIGFDLTKPLLSAQGTYEKAPFPEVDLKRFNL